MPEANNPNLNGSERAAIFMMTLGEAEAALVLRHMDPKEVQAIGSAMAVLKNVSKQQVGEVLDEFHRAIEGQTALGINSDDYIRKMLVEALGADKASGLIDRILLGRNSKGLEALKWMDPRAVAEIIRYEHPQIMAIVLSYLEADQSAEILTYFPDRVQADVLMRIATLDGILPSALQELDDILEKQFAGNSNTNTPTVGGVKAVADIMNLLDSSMEVKLSDAIKSVDEDLAQQIQDLMFVFADLVNVDDRGIQTLLREVSSDQLVVALKAADEALKEKIFKNMSQRAAEMLRDDLDSKGPVRISDVETAQKEILGVAKRLSDAGQIALGGAGGDEFV